MISFIRRQFSFQSSKNQKKNLFMYFVFFFHLYIKLKNIVVFNEFKSRRSKITKTIKTRRRKINFIFVFIFCVIEHVNIKNEINWKTNVVTIFANCAIIANFANNSIATKKNKNATKTNFAKKRLMLIIRKQIVYKFVFWNEI